MEIVWLGHSSFRIKGKEVTIVTDPYDSSIGIKFPKLEADIVTISHSHSDHGKLSLVEGSPFAITGPGEYEVKGISIFGVGSFHDKSSGSERGNNTIYSIEIDNVKVCHLGDLGHSLSESQIEDIGAVDILLVPVGGFYTIDAEEAVKVVGALEPKIVIPMHYKTPELDEKTFGSLSSVEEFLRHMGAEKNISPKLTVTAEKLPTERQVVVLERKG
jgi:L-ascorbate metabolism protein UlaG (beta-lactamase superfamily)